MKGTTLLLLLCGTLQLLATCGWCRRPLIRAPRDARTTGHYTVVLKKDTSEEEYLQATVKISRMGEVHGRTHRLLKTLTLDVSPYALERVSLHMRLSKRSHAIAMYKRTWNVGHSYVYL